MNNERTAIDAVEIAGVRLSDRGPFRLEFGLKARSPTSLFSVIVPLLIVSELLPQKASDSRPRVCSDEHNLAPPGDDHKVSRCHSPDPRPGAVRIHRISAREVEEELSRALLNLAERDGRASYPQFTAQRGIPA